MSALRVTRITRWVSIFAFVAGPVVAHGQTPAPLRLSLATAQARAIEVSHRLEEARALATVAEAAVDAQAVATRPHVALRVSYTRTNHVTEFGVPGAGGSTRIIYPDVADNLQTRLNLEWLVYDGGQTTVRRNSARAEVDVAEADIRVTEAQLRLNVSRTFWSLVAAGSAVEVLERAVARAVAHLNLARERLAAGVVAPNDVSSAEAQVAREQMALIEARNQRDMHSAALARLVGIDLLQSIVPDDSLALPDSTTLTLGELVADATMARPERRALDLRIDTARLQRTVADSVSRPSLAIIGGVDVARPNTRIFPRAANWNESWDVGLSMNWPLTDGGARAAAVSQASRRIDVARARLDEFDSQLALEIQQLLLRLNSGLAAVTTAGEVIRASTEALRVTTERYAAGVALQIEVLDAEFSLLQAELERTRALTDVRLREAELEHARGR